MSHCSSILTRARLFAAFLLAAVAFAASAGAAHAGSVTALERRVIDRLYGQMHVYEPWGNNDLSGSPSYELYINGSYQPWCGSFMNWALRAAGVNPQSAARGGNSFNVNVAKAWSVYGPRGGGYGRYAYHHNAMPGDLLVYGYDGTARSGGHVTMVVAPVAGNPRYVYTIGGNEGNRVRLQRRDLSAAGAYLVTLSEFRRQRTDLFSEYNTRLTDIGDVWFNRFYTAGLARVQAAQVVMENGNVYTGGAAMDGAGFRSKTNRNTYLSGQTFQTDMHDWIHLFRTPSNMSASMAGAPTPIDFSRVTSSSGTS